MPTPHDARVRYATGGTRAILEGAPEGEGETSRGGGPWQPTRPWLPCVVWASLVVTPPEECGLTLVMEDGRLSMGKSDGRPETSHGAGERERALVLSGGQR